MPTSSRRGERRRRFRTLSPPPGFNHIYVYVYGPHSYAALDETIEFVSAVEARLNECLRNGTIPDPDLVDAISVCKIKAIEVSIAR